MADLKVSLVISAVDLASAALKEVKQQITSLGTAATTVASEAKTLENAFKTLKIPSVAGVNEEIQKLQSAYSTIRNSATSTFRDIQNATIALKTKTEELQASLTLKKPSVSSNPLSNISSSEIEKSTGAIRGLMSSFGELGLTIASTYAIYKSFALARESLKFGFNYDKQMESSKLGIASLLTATQEIYSADGRRLTGTEKLNEAQKISVDLMKQLQVAGFETTATTDQLVKGFQNILAPASKAGLSLEQIKSLTVLSTQAMAALTIPMEEFGAEIRAVVTGDINIMQDRLAVALGITGEMVQKWKENGTLFAELTNRMEAFKIAGVETQKTWAGLASNIKEAAQIFAGQGFSGIFEGTKSGAKELLDFIFKIDQETKKWNFSEPAAAIKDMMTSLSNITGTGIAVLAKDLTSAFQSLGEFLKTSGENVKSLFANGSIAGYELVKVIGQMVQMILSLGTSKPILDMLTLGFKIIAISLASANASLSIGVGIIKTFIAAINLAYDAVIQLAQKWIPFYSTFVNSNKIDLGKDFENLKNTANSSIDSIKNNFGELKKVATSSVTFDQFGTAAAKSAATTAGMAKNFDDFKTAIDKSSAALSTQMSLLKSNYDTEQSLTDGLLRGYANKEASLNNLTKYTTEGIKAITDSYQKEKKSVDEQIAKINQLLSSEKTVSAGTIQTIGDTEKAVKLMIDNRTKDYTDMLKTLVAKEKEFQDSINQINQEIYNNTKSYNDKLRGILQAGMSDTEVAADKMKALSEKFAQAIELRKDKGVISGEDTNKIEQVKSLLLEVQNGYLDVGQAATKASRERQMAEQVARNQLELDLKSMDSRAAAQEKYSASMSEISSKYASAGYESAAKNGAAAAKEVYDEFMNSQKSINEKGVETTKNAIKDVASQMETLKNDYQIIKSQIENNPFYLSVNMDGFKKDAISGFEAIKKQIEGTQISLNTTVTSSSVSGGSTTGYATGGFISGYGGGDRIRALLEAGEFVVRKEAVRNLGVNTLLAINNLRMPSSFPTVKPNLTLPGLPTLKFADGGLVPSMAGIGGGGMHTLVVQVGKDSIKTYAPPSEIDVLSKIEKSMTRKRKVGIQ